MAVRRPTQRRRARSSTGDDSNVATIHAVRERPKIEVVVEELADFNESFNWCLYGDSGVGKTVFTSFAPRAHILSTEKGVIAAKRAGSKAKLLRAPNWDHVEANIEWADKHLTENDVLIVDSVTKMQDMALDWWLGIQHDENAARDRDIPQIQDHQKWQRMFMRFVNGLIDARYNTIFVATSMRKEDEEGDDLVLPNIVGKDYAIAQNFCAAMDIVSCLRVKKRSDIDAPREAMLINDTFPPYFAKDRFNVLPRWETIPDGEVVDEDGIGGYDSIVGMIEDILATSPEVRKAAKAGRQ
jgi:DNA replication protein DnaC